MRLNWRAAAVFLALLAPVGARAQACSVSTSGGLAFGSYRPSNTLPTDTTANIVMSCNATVGLLVSYTIRLQSASGRKMAGPYGTLSYVLATDPQFVDSWPDNRAVAGSILLTALSLFGTRQQAVYARLAAGQRAGPGSYTDTLMVVVTY